MRPIRLTGITGNSPVVPLDVYTIAASGAIELQGTGTLELTVSDVFNPAVVPVWNPAPPVDTTTGLAVIPAGTRAVRATGMVPASVLIVSQQGII
jgi:hypothetical protein